MRPMYIAFEGADGVGKSSLAHAFAQWAGKEFGSRVFVASRPGCHELGYRVQAMNRDANLPMVPDSRQLLMAADEATYQRAILRDIVGADWVVQDRHHPVSCFVYHYWKTQDQNRAAFLSKVVDSMPVDLIVYVHCDPAIAWQRATSSNDAKHSEAERSEFEKFSELIWLYQRFHNRQFDRVTTEQSCAPIKGLCRRQVAIDTSIVTLEESMEDVISAVYVAHDQLEKEGQP